LAKNHFSTDSLTWREFLTFLTTCFFYHGPENPVLQPNSTQFPQGEDKNNNKRSIPLRNKEGNDSKTTQVLIDSTRADQLA
jgi:hypothetical protein